MPESLTSLSRKPGLLVSVRNVQEANAALAGGADVIDVKEPSRGPLGYAESGVVAEVVRAVAGRRAVTAAAGDLGERRPAELAEWAAAGGASVIKVGLPDGLTVVAEQMFERATRHCRAGVRVAPAIYADRRHGLLTNKHVPPGLTDFSNSGWLVIDTFEKGQGDLFDHRTKAEIAQVVKTAHANGLRVVLAGGLCVESFDTAVLLAPDLIGVRGAACVGGREGEVSPEKVAVLANRLARCDSRIEV